MSRWHPAAVGRQGLLMTITLPMKRARAGTSRVMAQIQRVVRIALGMVGTIAIFAGVAVLTLRYVLLNKGYVEESRLLAKDFRGRSVVYEFEACTTIGTQVDARVDFVEPSGEHQSLF